MGNADNIDVNLFIEGLYEELNEGLFGILIGTLNGILNGILNLTQQKVFNTIKSNPNIKAKEISF